MNHKQADKLRECINEYCRASEHVSYIFEHCTDSEHERAVDIRNNAKDKLDTLLDELTVS